MNSLESDARLAALLARLHGESEAQMPALLQFFEKHGGDRLTGTEAEIAAGRPFWHDKLVAIDPGKAQFCYRLCRALGLKLVRK